MDDNHYQVLGVPENATESEIKAAWRAIAFEHHPDRNNGVESDLFNRASIAWGVLGDVAKRRTYDAQRFAIDTAMKDSVSSTGDHPFQGDVFNVLFEEMAKMRSFFGDEHVEGGGSRGTSYVKPHAILKSVSIPLNDAFTRPDISVPIRRWRVENGHKVEEEAVLLVQVPILDENGCGTVLVKGEGNTINIRARGDVKIAFKAKMCNDIRLQGNGNVEVSWPISLRDSLSGFQTVFDHPNGKQYAISSRGAVIPPGHKHVLPGLGLDTKSGLKGDYILVFKIEFPNQIAPELKSAIEKWL